MTTKAIIALISITLLINLALYGVPIYFIAKSHSIVGVMIFFAGVGVCFVERILAHIISTIRTSYTKLD